MGIPNCWNLPPVGFPAARDWLAFDVEELKIPCMGSDRRCYVEVGEPRVLAQEDIGSELFNHELAKCDVTDPSSLFRFVAKFGLPVSTLYEGHQRLSWFRNRHLKPYESLLSAGALRMDSVRAYGDVLGIVAGYETEQGAYPTSENPLERVLDGALVSEMARKELASDRRVRGVVSELEVAQTLRLLQCATSVVASLRAECEAGEAGDVGRACAYLQDPRAVRREGLCYFRSPDLAPYDERMARDEAFRADAEAFEREGGRPRVLYEESQAEALHDAALEAQRYLSLACQSSALPLALGSPKEAGYFARQSAKRRDSALLERIAEHGSLTEAIARQFLETNGAEEHWQTCEYCGRRFKRAKEANPEKNIRKTRFCCRSCNVSFNRKNAASRTAERDGER